MTTQEKVREGIEKLFLEKVAQLKNTGVTGNVGKDFMEYLHSQGVVIRGESLGALHPHLADYFTVKPLVEERK